MADKYQFVQVLWLDAWQDQENFASAHGIRATHEPMPVETIGWLVVNDEVGISVANERTMQDGVDMFRGRTLIPRAMVKSVTPYNLTKPRSKRAPAPVETLPTTHKLAETPT